MTNSNPVRGMRDFLPHEKARRERAIRSIRETYGRHGFAEIETPFVESLEHLISDQGGENEKMLFKVLKRGLHVEALRSAASPDELCDMGLRFDLTVGLSRYYANNRGKLPDVSRVMHIGPVWRAERPQKGRYRQFVQCDIDVIGEPSGLAEVELISTTLRALAQLGLEGLTLRLNDRRLLTALLRSSGAPEAAWSRCLIAVDKLDKIGHDGVVEELRPIVPADVVERLSAALAALEDPAFELGRLPELIGEPDVADVIANLERILAGVGAAAGDGVTLRFDGSLVRGMGYYTGPIFELWHPGFGGAVAGGGRYDDMIGRFSGTSVPATGFSIGFERIVDLLELPADDGRAKVAIVYERGVDWGALVALQATVVDRGDAVRLVPRPKRLGPMLDGLAAEGFSSWVEVGADGSAGDPRALS